ncbi:hypothetical protein [Actinomadura rudentiformis]|uniref:Uncharacterized protein n=1 Tax=Actinomadura rudentiformis TaxID=359158 RepID=A0A6H9Z046_9ACTN|nr:hypothetical protein [Actinomadura rudentiformis]KAB2348519.1 hypothetical protein F8566_17215 [Actinomadura rudentiformis]
MTDLKRRIPAAFLAAALLLPGAVHNTLPITTTLAQQAARRRRGGGGGGGKKGGRSPIARPLRMGMFKPGKGAPGGGARPRTPPGARGAPHEHPRGINDQQQKGHIKGTPQYDNRRKQGKPTSTWNGDESFANAHTFEAWYKGTPDSRRPEVRVYDYGPGHVTGYSPQGQPQHKVKVHMNNEGMIHGHPK